MNDVVKTPEQIAAEVKEQKAAAKAQADAKKAEEKAKADALKAEAKAKSDAVKAEAKAKKEAEAAEVKAKKEAAAKLAAEEKAKTAAVVKEKVTMPSQNGITRPKADGACGQVWALADQLSAQLKQPVPIAQLSKATSAAGLNDATTRTQYARWKQFNGVFGTVPKIEEAAPVATTAPVETAPSGEVAA